MFSEEEVFLEFRYKKNQLLFFPDGKQYIIPMEMRELTLEQSNGHRDSTGRHAVVPVFRLNEIHKYPLQSEAIPELDDVPADSRLAKELEEDAYRAAREARIENDHARRFFYHMAGQGILEIVNDPFKNRLVKVGKKSLKPSQLTEAPKAK